MEKTRVEISVKEKDVTRVYDFLNFFKQKIHNIEVLKEETIVITELTDNCNTSEFFSRLRDKDYVLFFHITDKNGNEI